MPPAPVNRFPLFVRDIIQRLKASVPGRGVARIAGMLARAGLHVARTTVRRFLKDPLRHDSFGTLETPPATRRIRAEKVDGTTHRPSADDTPQLRSGDVLRARTPEHTVGSSQHDASIPLGNINDETNGERRSPSRNRLATIHFQ